jgi:hypothetical protein
LFDFFLQVVQVTAGGISCFGSFHHFSKFLVENFEDEIGVVGGDGGSGAGVPEGEVDELEFMLS